MQGALALFAALTTLGLAQNRGADHPALSPPWAELTKIEGAMGVSSAENWTLHAAVLSRWFGDEDGLELC